MTIFERVKLDTALVEVGMGGRLDATNTIPEKTVVSALASTNLNHLGIWWQDCEREGGGCEERKVVCVGEAEVLQDREGPYWSVWSCLVRAVEPIDLPSEDLRDPTPVS